MRSSNGFVSLYLPKTKRENGKEMSKYYEHKYDYSIVGHDGESPVIPFVEWGKPPKTKKDR